MRSVVLSTRLPVGIAAAVIGLLVALLSLQLGAGSAAEGHGSAVLHACWLTAKVEANWSNGVLELSYVLQPPNPCHRVYGVAVNYDPDQGAVVLTVEGESPPQGTYCIQVLPPPVTGHGRVHGVREVRKIIVVLHDRAAGRTCRAEALLR